jgi:diguanylate cyclase (GGDEF)-like protein
VSDRIQERISHYGENTFSTSIYFSAAHLDQGLRAQKIQAKLDQQKRITNLLAAGFAGAMVFLIIIGFLYQSTRKLERLRRFNEERFELAVAGTNDGIFDCDYHSGQFFLSPLMQTLLGNPDLTDKQSIDAVINEVIHPADGTATMKTIRAYIAAPVNDYLDTEFRILRHTDNDAEMWVRLRGKAILAPDGSAQRISGSLSDTSKIHLQEAAIRHQSLHDALTGLPNRALLIDRLEQAVGQAHRIKGQFALMVMDLDRFKHINDTLGHAVGDRIIQQLGNRLHAVLRDTDTVSRLGGDEFAMLLPLTSEPQAKHVARKILLALKRPFQIEEHNLVVDGSIGVATYPLNGSSAEEILRHADVAMYLAKSSGEAVAFYDYERDPNSVRLLALEHDLRNAIQNDSLELHFQPKVDLRKKVITGSEALVRWTHTELGAIPPIEIIQIAERTGLIRPLTRWVLMAALRQAAHWASLGIDIPIAVNLSIWDMQDPDFVEYVREGLRRWNRVPENIEFEITESVMMVDPNRAIMALTRLSKMGIKLAVDDFGTGFSSLAYLKKFPVSTLKIDKSFVIDMMNDPSDRAIVKSTLELAHHMGISAVAEGVEDAETLNELARLGCDTAQGYFIAKPMPPSVFVNWLRESVWGLDSALPEESFVTVNDTSLH